MTLRADLVRILGSPSENLLKEIEDAVSDWRAELGAVSVQRHKGSGREEAERLKLGKARLARPYKLMVKFRTELGLKEHNFRKYWGFDDLFQDMQLVEKRLAFFFKPGKRGPKPTAPIRNCARIAFILEAHGVQLSKGRDGVLAKVLEAAHEAVGRQPPGDMTYLLRNAVDERVAWAYEHLLRTSPPQQHRNATASRSSSKPRRRKT